MPPLITPRGGARPRRARATTPRSRRSSSGRGRRAPEHFGDSTDMCSLVNAKSGGCAEDCGFCAQSRFAEAETPMHAMMEPEQILEHARAAEAAGAHRFCMVTQGQGLSKRDFEKVLEGARLVAEHTNLKRCASIGHMSVDAREGAQGRRHPARAPQRRDRRVLLPRGLDHRPLRGPAAHDRRGRARRAWRPASAASSTSARRREQRVEMAFELAEIDPTSVPINLLNPRPGTKFGDRDYMDPWEAVKWIAIFRLILPAALFRLCGGRVENLGELQPLAVKAGLNGVMMGNFLTTLGNTPDEDRAMFEELGLNVAPPARQRREPAARQPLGLAGRRDPRRRRELPRRGHARRADRDPPLGPLDPAALRAQDVGPAPPRRRAQQGARRLGRLAVHCTTPWEERCRTSRTGWTSSRSSASIGACAWSPGRRARAWCSTAGPCCCCAPTTTSGSPTTRACARRRPTRRCAGASAPARRGWCRAT